MSATPVASPVALRPPVVGLAVAEPTDLSTKMNSFGALNRASCDVQCGVQRLVGCASASVAQLPRARRLPGPTGRSARPTTSASATAGCARSTSSTSSTNTFSPPVLTTSESRPNSRSVPSASSDAAVAGDHDALPVDHRERLAGGVGIVEVAERNPAGSHHPADLGITRLQEPASVLGHHQRRLRAARRCRCSRPALAAPEAHVAGLRRSVPVDQRDLREQFQQRPLVLRDSLPLRRFRSRTSTTGRRNLAQLLDQRRRRRRRRPSSSCRPSRAPRSASTAGGSNFVRRRRARRAGREQRRRTPSTCRPRASAARPRTTAARRWRTLSWISVDGLVVGARPSTTTYVSLCRHSTPLGRARRAAGAVP